MNWRKNLWSLWCGCLISSSSYTMIIPFLPLYLLDLGADQTNISLWSGLIFSSTFFVSAVMAPYWGRRADHAGKKRMLLRAGYSLAFVYCLGAFVKSPLELLAVRILHGISTGFVPASLTIVASSVPEERMGYSLGLMQTATLTGSIIGPLFGGILAHLFGIRASFAVAAAVMLAGTVAVKVLVTEPARTEVSRSGGILDDCKLALGNKTLMGTLLLLLAAQIAVMSLQPIITLYVAELQGRMEGAVLASGVVFSLAGIAGAMAAPLWGKLGQREGFYQALMLIFFGAGVFYSSVL